MKVTVAPTPLPRLGGVETAGTLKEVTVTVRDSAGGPIAGATVTIQNFDLTPVGIGRPTVFTTDDNGRAVFMIAFYAKMEMDPAFPTEHVWDMVDEPSGEVTKVGFHAATLPLVFKPPPPR
jgi:hypothetical protein